MKRLLRLTTLLAVVLTAVSCEKNPSDVVPTLEVTANNISGIWQLSEWSGHTLEEGTYVYLEITRRNQLFTIYDNLDSFSAVKSTGRYNIITDDEHGAVIRGQYDYGKGDWRHRYIIRDLTKSSMTWVALDDADDISVYVRCDAIPEEILAELPADED